MNNKLKITIVLIIFFTILISGVALLIMAFYIDENSEKEIEKVDCFDKHNNKIEDIKCEQEIFMNDNDEIKFILCITLGLLICFLTPVLLLPFSGWVDTLGDKDE